MIETWHVREVVRGLFGSALADSPGFAEGLASVLRSYSSYKEDFYSLAARVEDHLFNALYERLGPGMCVRLPSGSVRRIRLAELPEAADEIMEVFFSSLKPYSVNYELLRAYWLKTGSFAAMRVLYRNYEHLLPAQDRYAMERIARENMFPAGWEVWMK